MFAKNKEAKTSWNAWLGLLWQRSVVQVIQPIATAYRKPWSVPLL